MEMLYILKAALIILSAGIIITLLVYKKLRKNVDTAEITILDRRIVARHLQHGVVDGKVIMGSSPKSRAYERELKSRINLK